MPGRKKKIYTDGVYHVFNKTIGSRRIFDNDYHCKLFLETIRYYRSSKTRIGLAALSRLAPLVQQNILKEVEVMKFFRVQIFSFILMPTHYHLLLKQNIDRGVEQFISDSINSFTRHINVKNDKKGPIFLTKFKAVPVVSDEQLIHTSRYIHLNCYSSDLITNIQSLVDYPWSSYREYIKMLKQGICYINPVMKLFGNNPVSYKKFVENHADYQRTLEHVKYADTWI